MEEKITLLAFKKQVRGKRIDIDAEEFMLLVQSILLKAQVEKVIAEEQVYEIIGFCLSLVWQILNEPEKVKKVVRKAKRNDDLAEKLKDIVGGSENLQKLFELVDEFDDNTK